MNTSGTVSHLFLAWSSWIVKREILIGFVASKRSPSGVSPDTSEPSGRRIVSTPPSSVVA